MPELEIYYALLCIKCIDCENSNIWSVNFIYVLLYSKQLTQKEHNIYESKLIVGVNLLYDRIFPINILLIH